MRGSGWWYRSWANARRSSAVKVMIRMTGPLDAVPGRFPSAVYADAQPPTICARPGRAEYKQVARQRFSRWPVVEPETGRPVGYLLAKDLIAEGSVDADWTPLVRPLRAVRPEDDIESTLMQLQQEGATVCVIQDAGSPVGLITIEDIL